MEGNARNQRMAKVGKNTSLTYEKLATDPNVGTAFFEWNQGGHFADAANRQAKAILWLMKNA